MNNVLLKKVYFIVYPIIVMLAIPYGLLLLYGDGITYRTEGTLWLTGLLCFMNGPLLYLLLLALPQQKYVIYLHYGVIVYLIFLPFVFLSIMNIYLSYFQLLLAILSIDIFVVFHHLRKLNRKPFDSYQRP